MSIKNVVNKRLFFKNGSDEINNEIEDEIFKFNSSEKILCIGDVQSGKTGVMIRTIKKSLAHGYKMTIILAAHTKILVNQTKERVEQEFENDRNVSIYEIDETSYIHTSLRYVNQHLVFVLLKSSSIDKTLGELYDLIEQHKT
jgi:RecG-like helicase